METKNTLLELAKNELLMNRLYSQYSKNLPELKGFWDDIATDEIDHYNMVLELNRKVDEGTVFVDKDRFKLEAVELVGKFLSEKIDEAQTNKLSLVESLSVAENVENSLLERNIFKIFEADSADLKNLLDNLRIETEEHLREVQEQIKIHVPERA